MIATTTAPRHLEPAALRRLGELCGITTWPVVLDLWPVDDDETAHAHSAAALDRVLDQCGVLTAGAPTVWTDTVLSVLARPDHELEIRRFASGSVVRATLARRGHDHVLAVRDGEVIELQVLDVVDAGTLGAVVRRLCGPHPPMDFGEVSVPTRELGERFGTCTDAAAVTAALRSWGATPSDAVRVADAFYSAGARWEIVAATRTGGTLIQTSGAIGIIDSGAGRILMGLSASPDARLWTTITPGSGYRIGQAVIRLIETLPGQRWFGMSGGIPRQQRHRGEISAYPAG
ncbi:ESX secretion-associated protein EspG [Gordonia sp. DT30]|uniref:ESX secretion-associated protein EspG n=1 Tax=unclassified Gordonia (in: high G+C Gram-positive bacteria) TaxID=2657482 RepID=UPI003CE9C8C3